MNPLLSFKIMQKCHSNSNFKNNNMNNAEKDNDENDNNNNNFGGDFTKIIPTTRCTNLIHNNNNNNTIRMIPLMKRRRIRIMKQHYVVVVVVMIFIIIMMTTGAAAASAAASEATVTADVSAGVVVATATNNEYNNRISTNKYDSSYSKNSTSTSSSSSYGSDDPYDTSGYDSYKKKVPPRIDYSVLSVGVMTLGLIMIVESIRHKLDHTAKTKPFFQAVLNMVYTELSTLGIVEFFLYLLAEYYVKYDKDKKQVFADIHFLLFYTAIFNAFQTVLLASISRTVSTKLWVQSEMLELHHYIEIREEYQNVENELQNMKQKKKQQKQRSLRKQKNQSTLITTTASTIHTSNNGPTTSNKNQLHLPTASDESNFNDTNNNLQSSDQDLSESDTQQSYYFVEPAFEFTKQSFIDHYELMMDRIRYPGLKRKYNELMIQIRFHQIRIAFLQAYDMPMNLKVSDYLRRCELDVLKELVHVSSTAWLLLTGAINLLYYILGMITYKVHDPSLIGTILIIIFYMCTICFFFVAWVTYNKLKCIFRSMMVDQTLWQYNNNNTTADMMPEEDKVKLHDEQLSLFWFQTPLFIISLIQFMQFGYAVAFSALIIYWEEINDAAIPMYIYLFAILICYGLFLYMIGQALPRYTMCTSLAQFVNHPLLRETVANHKLDEERTKQDEYNEEIRQIKIKKLQLMNHTSCCPNDGDGGDCNTNVGGGCDDDDDDNKNGPNQCGKNTVICPTTMNNDNAILCFDGACTTATTTTDLSTVSGQNVSCPTSDSVCTNNVVATNFSSCTKTNTMLDSPCIDKQNYDHIDDTNLLRHLRNNKNSNMSCPFSTETTNGGARLDTLGELQQTPRTRRKKCCSDGVKAMSLFEESSYNDSLNKGDCLMEKDNSETHDNGNGDLIQFPSLTQDMITARRQQRRTNRRSISDGVAFMVKMNSSMEDSTRHNNHHDSDITFHSKNSMDGGSSKNSSSQLSGLNTTASRPLRKKLAIDSMDIMVKLVNQETSELRNLIPSNHHDLKKEHSTSTNGDSKHGLSSQRSRNRVQRVKSNSTGVSSMTAESLNTFNTISSTSASEDLTCKVVDLTLSPATDVQDANGNLKPNPLNRRQRRRRSVSDGVALMAKVTAGEDSMVRPTLLNVHEISTSPLDPQTQNVVPNPSISHHDGPIQDMEKQNESVEPIPDDPDPDIPNEICSVTKADDGSTSTDGYYSDSDEDSYYSQTMKDPVPLKPRIPLKVQVQEYYLNKKYIVLDNVFGTFIAFFLVAKRVEFFLHSEAIVSENFVSFHVPQQWSFWMLTSWFIFFNLSSILSMYVMIPLVRQNNLLSKKIAYTAVLDVLISGFCLWMLLLAESQRCCHIDPTASLEDDLDESKRVDHGEICSCPSFGHRTYGGLGNIEPFTSLVAFRLLRHYMARRFLWYFSATNDEKKQIEKCCKNAPLAVLGHHITDDSHHSDNGEFVGTVTQLWEDAIMKHPELVAKYGELSGELLRAMLGLSLLEPMEQSPDSQNTNTPALTSIAIPESALQSTPMLADEMIGKDTECGPCEATIPTACQQNDCMDLLKQGRFGQNECKIGMNICNIGTSITAQLPFRCPKAPLLRSMRRCDRKLLPLIDKWTVVDVVMTRFEIIYFDAVGADDVVDTNPEDLLMKELVATKGGKSLRLGEVAVGRKVVGQLKFSDVRAIYVDRFVPGCPMQKCLEGGCNQEVEKTEYWMPPSETSALHSKTRTTDWSLMKQDVLRIQTVHGRSLCLRFYSDLEQALHHEDRLADENEICGSIFRNNALQWAQTIGRICTPQHLNQSLPHFGEDNCNELRDYIVLHNKPETNRGLNRNRPVEVATIRQRDTDAMAAAGTTILPRLTLRRVQTVSEGLVNQTDPPNETQTNPLSPLPKLRLLRPQTSFNVVADRDESMSSSLVVLPKPKRNLLRAQTMGAEQNEKDSDADDRMKSVNFIL